MALLNERRLSWWAASAAGASMVFITLGLLLILGAVSTAAGEYVFISTLGFWAGMALLIGYSASLYLLITLPGKSHARRVSSWTFSIVFHVVVVVCAAILLSFRDAVGILMMPEIVTIILSVAGLVLAARGRDDERTSV